MRTLLLLTLLHLLVDALCAASLAVYALKEVRYAAIVYYFTFYTIIAFGLQGLVGYVVDRHGSYGRYYLLGMAVLLTLGSLSSLGITGQVVLLGLGNCLFHVVGGSYVLRRYSTYTPVGFFVCSGALGLGMGLNSLVDVEALLGALVLVTALSIISWRSESEKHTAFPPVREISPRYALLCIFLLFGCIVLRGMSSASGAATYPVLLLPCVMACGKVVGGVLSDYVGYRRTVLLIFALGFLGLQSTGSGAELVGLFAANLTMALTLRLAHFAYPKAPAFIFGLAASCLVPGALVHGSFILPSQLIIVLQFLILSFVGRTLLKEERYARA